MKTFDHDRLVQLVYDAVDEPAGFDPVLKAVGDVLDANACHMLALPAGEPFAENHGYGSDPSSFVEYNEVWRTQDPRFAIANAQMARVLSDVAVIDPSAFERSAIYNEHLAKSDVRYTLFTTAPAASDLLLGQAFMRSARREPFGPEDIATMENLLPHFLRAARLRHVVRTLRSDLSDLRRALDLVPTATLILDSLGKVLCTNGAAATLLRANDGLVTRAGILAAERPAEAQALAAAIARTAKMADACRDHTPPPHLTASAFVSRAARAPLALVLLILRPRSCIRETSTSRARILAVVHDPELRVRLEPSLVAKVHGLTPTEAALAAALAEGRSVAEFAEIHGSSEQTARTHLKRVLEKTGVRRQPDLVRLLLSAAAAHQLRG